MEALKIKAKEYFPVWVTTIVISIGMYSLLMICQLTNNVDGLWQQSLYYAGDHEVGIGRWLWPILDKLQLGIHVDPFTSLASIIIVSTATIIILECYGIGRKWLAYLTAVMIAVSMPILATLEYRYMSVIFSCAFLFAGVTAYLYINIKKRILAIIALAVGIMFSMSLYQAYLGCICLIVLVYLIYKLQNNEMTTKEALIYIGQTVGGVLAGGILYFISMRLAVLVYGCEVSNYNGANNITFLSILTNLPKTFLRAYQGVGTYFSPSYFHTNRLARFGLYYIVLAGIIVTVVFGAIKVFKQNKINTIIYVLAYALIPFAVNVSLALAPESVLQIQMTVSSALIIPIFAVVNRELLTKKRIVSAAMALILVTVLYGDALQIITDQDAMYEGQKATETILDGVYADLMANNQLTNDAEYFFIGKPVNNPMFYVSPLYEEASFNARYGDFYLHHSSMYASYRGFFQGVMKANIPLSFHEYDDLAYSDYMIPDMPCYPNEGYILQWGSFIIVKISND